MNSRQYFITKDLTLAATLKYFSEEVVDLRLNENREVEFIFDNKREVRELVNNYSLGKLPFSPKDFSQNLKELKRAIFVEKEKIRPNY